MHKAHSPKILGFRDIGKKYALKVKFPGKPVVGIEIEKDFKDKARDLTVDEYQNILFRNFDFNSNQSIAVYFQGGLGDTLIALEVFLSFKEFLRKNSKAKFEFVGLFTDHSECVFFRRYLSETRIFDRYEVISEDLEYKYSPHLLLASPHEIRAEYYSIGSMWDLLWARWAIPGKFSEAYPKTYKKTISRIANRELRKMRLASVLPQSNYILIVPQDATGGHKLWLDDNWSELLTNLLRSTKKEFVVLTTDEKQKKILGKDSRVHFYDYKKQDKSDFLNLLALVQGSHGVISLDTGPAHVAGHLSKDCITLFGPSNPVYYGHRNNVNIRLSACPPCWPRQRMQICQNNICMQELNPKLIALFVKQKFEI